MKIAVAQTHPLIGDVSASVSEGLRLIAEAAVNQVQLLVLPELANAGYAYRDIEELRTALGNGDGLKDFISASRKYRMVIVVGFARLSGQGAFNSAAMIDNGELLAVYDKVHLWDTEKIIFTPGDSLPPVVQTSVGKVGVAICYDLEFPELTRDLALRGAQIIAAPTNWPTGFEPPTAYGPFGVEMIKAMAAASANQIFIAIADRTGEERGISWVEHSSVIDPNGFPVAQLAHGVGLAVADVDLGAAKNKRISVRNDVFSDRRIDLY